MALNIDSKLGELMENPDAKAILAKHLPSQVMESEKMQTMGTVLTIKQVAMMAGGMITDEMIQSVSDELDALGA